MTTVWVLTITHEYDHSTWVFSNEEKAKERLAEYVAEYWDQDGPSDPISDPVSGEDIVAYFESDMNRESFQIDDVEIDAP